jgi:flavin reductase (DIM6/NTAB) family NADH-FMN oxidoreductase RutF
MTILYESIGSNSTGDPPMQTHSSPAPTIDRLLLPEAADRFIAAMGRAATGVSVVTTAGPAGRFGVTVSAVSSVSADPPMVLACINRRSPIGSAIARNGVLCINVLADRQRHIADVFAGRPVLGGPYDFGCADWLSGSTGAPVLAGAAAAFDCEMEIAYDAGSHRIFIGRVALAIGGEGDPLVYAMRRYRRIAELDA